MPETNLRGHATLCVVPKMSALIGFYRDRLTDMKSENAKLNDEILGLKAEVGRLETECRRLHLLLDSYSS
jgi:hypothetical protein